MLGQLGKVWVNPVNFRFTELASCSLLELQGQGELLMNCSNSTTTTQADSTGVKEFTLEPPGPTSFTVRSTSGGAHTGVSRWQRR
jgi:hypothetical protein